jgi:hypothetical protein
LRSESPGKFDTYSSTDNIFSGDLLGKKQRVILHLHDSPFQSENLKGLQAELQDCAFPLLDSVVTTSDLDTVFKDTEFNFLLENQAS